MFRGNCFGSCWSTFRERNLACCFISGTSALSVNLFFINLASLGGEIFRCFLKVSLDWCRFEKITSTWREVCDSFAMVYVLSISKEELFRDDDKFICSDLSIKSLVEIDFFLSLKLWLRMEFCDNFLRFYSDFWFFKMFFMFNKFIVNLSP